MSNDTGINIHSSAKHRRAIAKEKEVVSIPHQTSRWRERCAHAHSTSAFKACCRQNAFPESVVHYRLRSTGRIVITCSLIGIRELRITLYGIGETETTCVWHVLCILFNLSRKHARSRLSCVSVSKTLCSRVRINCIRVFRYDLVWVKQNLWNKLSSKKSRNEKTYGETAVLACLTRHCVLLSWVTFTYLSCVFSAETLKYSLRMVSRTTRLSLTVRSRFRWSKMRYFEGKVSVYLCLKNLIFRNSQPSVVYWK